MRTSWAVTVLIVAAIGNSVAAQGLKKSLFDVESGAKLDAKPLYPITKDAPEWLVRACSFNGNQALTHANAICKELREKHGIEAYAAQFKVTTEWDKPAPREFRDNFEKQFRVRPRVPVLKNAPPDNWAVLCGGFDSRDNPGIERLQRKLGKIDPKSVPESVWREMRFTKKDGTVNKPFAAPMLARNPTHPPIDPNVIDVKTAKLLLELNGDEPYSAFNIKAPYTIIVQEFRGYSAVAGDKKPVSKLDWPGKETSKLQIAGQNAIILMDHLRRLGVEAYVFHGTFSSIVCVGGYQEANEPRMLADMNRLAEMRLGELKLEPKLSLVPKRPTLSNAAN